LSSSSIIMILCIGAPPVHLVHHSTSEESEGSGDHGRCNEQGALLPPDAPAKYAYSRLG